MPATTSLIQAKLTIDGVDTALDVAAARITDAIGALRRIEVALSPIDGELEMAALLRKGVQLDVSSKDGTQLRRFEGIVLNAREVWRDGGARYQFVIGSPLELLALSSDCRIFQEMTMPDIVQQVLTDAGFPAAHVVSRLTGTYATLASCTQYGETMLAFISRLLEADGAYYFFEDGESGLDLVLGDASSAHKPAKTATLQYIGAGGLLDHERITAITETEQIRPDTVTLRDLDFEKPDLDLTATKQMTGAVSREVYDHPGGYFTAADGKKRATTRIEGFVADATGIHAHGVAPALSAGSTFTLAGANVDRLNVEWLVTEVTHTFDANADIDRWETSLRAIPSSVTYRPLLKTPRPRIRGPQTAFITGPSGQEIHTDQYGRVKLKFHWDRHATFDEKSSAWARVAMLGLAGSEMIPRIGWEVVVEFEHGDPDRPVVIGRLYNGMYVPPYALPDNKTRSVLGSYSSPGGAGHNEIRIEDSAGNEHIHMHAQKDLELKVANDRNAHVTQSRMVTVKQDETITVKGNRTFEVKGLWDVTVAGNQSLTVEGGRTKTVKKDERISIEGDRTTTIDGAHDIQSKANLTVSTEGDVSATIATTLTESADEGASVVVGDDLTLTVGGPKAEIAKKGKTSTIEGKQTVTIGAARVDVSGSDYMLTVGGKRQSTVGAAWSVTATGDVQLSSGDALEVTVGAAASLLGATTVVLKCGDSKILIGEGGVTIQSSKIKVSSSGPLALTAAAILSK